MSERRVSKVCPTCGNQQFKKVRPKGWIAFVDDRKCLECGDVYTAPTPRWAGICFIIIGILFVLPLPLGVGIEALSGRANAPSCVCYSLLAALGCASFVHGMRSLTEAGKV